MDGRGGSVFSCLTDVWSAAAIEDLYSAFSCSGLLRAAAFAKNSGVIPFCSRKAAFCGLFGSDATSVFWSLSTVQPVPLEADLSRFVVRGASTEGSGSCLDLDRLNQNPSPISIAINTTTPTLIPMADEVLKCEVGSPPEPPSGAASLALAHLPSAQILPVVQSVSTEHEAEDSSAGLVVLGSNVNSAGVALSVEVVVSSSTNVNCASRENDKVVGRAVSNRKDADTGVLRVLVEVGCCPRDVVVVVDIILRVVVDIVQRAQK